MIPGKAFLDRAAGPFVLVVCNRKGGTGKTTTAVNLAAECARRGHRTLLVDLDTQGHAGLGLGIRAEPGHGRAHDIYRPDQGRLAPSVRASAHPQLDCAPANDLFQHPAGQGNTQALRQALADPAIANRYDLVVVDTPPSLDLLLLSALEAAQGLLVPTLPHHLGAEGVKQLFRLFYRVAANSNPNLRRFSLLPVMLDSRIRLHRKVLEDLRRQYGIQRMLRGIRMDIQLAEAFVQGQPIQTYAPRCRGAMDYALCLDELLACWKD